MTPRSLKLADHLSLPLDAVTQTIAILAKRRAGKSYTMRRLAEQLFSAGQQVVVVDPKGDQWGVRSAADGKAPGLPIVILGGERGDVPLEASSGEIVAKLVVEERVSVLLDLSLFRKHEIATFMTAFLENLYRLKAKEIYRTPVMLVIDEADAVAPQKPQKGEERMLGAAEDIVRRGGQRGIGCVLVSQRSAVLNKNVLTQAQMLVVLRTIAPQDLAAMKAWIDVHGDEEQGKTLMDSLPSLPIGDAWFWSPGWPTVDGIFKRVHVLPIETFDSGASPAPGVKPVEPKNLADVDLNALKGQMAATIEKAKADDPRELRKRIKQLENQVAGKALTAVAVHLEKQKPVLTDADRALIEKLRQKFEEIIGAFTGTVSFDVQAVADILAKKMSSFAADHHRQQCDGRDAFIRLAESKGFQKILDKLSAAGAAAPPFERPARAELRRGAPPTPRQAPSTRSTPARLVSGDLSLGKGERIILTAVAQYPDGATREQLTVLTGYARSSRDTYLQRLSQAGFIHQNGGGSLRATDAGVTALGDFEPLPTGDELRAYWMQELPEGERRVLEVLVRAYPKAVERSSIDDATGYARSSRDTYLQRLGARKLVVSTRDGVSASEELFS
jgi:Helicase HerA, central domain